MKTLVVEDSRLAREGLVKMLANHKNLEIIGSAKGVSEAFDFIKSTPPELIFLDIHLPGESGFDLLEKLDYNPRVIFTTAYSEYAIQSFDHRTIDYLLKPISHERLATAINKLHDSVASETTNTENTLSNEPSLELTSRIFVKDGDQCLLIQIANITYCESCKNYVQLYFQENNTEKEKAFIKKSLNQIEQRLPQRIFFRANRQFIINLNAVSSISEAVSDGFDLTMSHGKIVEVSRRNAARLKELLSM